MKQKRKQQKGVWEWKDKENSSLVRKKKKLISRNIQLPWLRR
jgi:hypothetical protein